MQAAPPAGERAPLGSGVWTGSLGFLEGRQENAAEEEGPLESQEGRVGVHLEPSVTPGP